MASQTSSTAPRGSAATAARLSSAAKLHALYQHARIWVRLYVRLRLPFINTQAIRRYLPSKGHIVDLGCGYGVLANSLALQNENWHLVGIDHNAFRIAQARATIRGRSNIEFRVGDVRDENEDADVVLMCDFLHHLSIEEQNRLLETVYQRLRPGGFVIILEASTRPAWKSCISRLSDWVLYPLSEKGNFRNPEVLAQVLQRIGYEVQLFDRPSGIFAGIGYACQKPERT
jgi:2-polyprenyl-3-methyl-5-hydroxy-6-metoxy-1,4-benzoquinol methylase